MIALVMFLCRCPFKPIVFYRCGHVISRSMHHGPPNASRNMSSPIPYGTHPLHQAFQHISFASTVQKVGRFRRLSPNDGIFHEAENGDKSQTRDFDGPYLAIGGTGSTIDRRRWRWGGPNPLGRQVASRNGTP